MAGDKKIVGLWRDSAAEEPQALAEDAVAIPADPVAETSAETRGWLDPLPTLDVPPAFDVLDDGATAPWLDHIIGPLLLGLGLTWTGLVGWIATSGGQKTPVLADIPALGLTLAGPLALLMLAWIVRLLSSRVRTAQFARVASGLRQENVRLQQSLSGLMAQLNDARSAMQDQGQALQRFGIDAAARMQESSSGLTGSMERIAAANSSLSQSSDTAMQRMEGLLAGLPRVDDVAQRLAENFSQAGRVAHQHGANLEAQLALLTDRASAADVAVQKLMDQLNGSFRTMEGQVEKLCNTVSLRSDAAAAVQKRALGLISKEQEAIEARVADALSSLQSVTNEARDRLASGCEESVAGLEARLAAATETSNSLAAQLAEHAGAAESLVKGLETAVVDVDARLTSLDGAVRDRTTAIGDALTALGSTVDGFADRSARGQDEVTKLLTGTDAVLTAIDAVTRELDESVPAAFGRIEASAGTARTLVAGLGAPLKESAQLAEQIEARLAETQMHATLVHDQLTRMQDERVSALTTLQGALTDTETQLQSLSLETGQFTQNGAADMLATMGQVREAASSAAGEARRLIEAAVGEASGTLRARAGEALDAALKSEIDTQLSAIEAAADRAVAAANSAADQLMRQLITIMDTSAQVEQRISDAETAIASTDRNMLAKQVVVLTDALKSTAIDLTKILSSEVSDLAWDAYLKGDRGVFSRRAVKLIDNAESREILKRYHEDAAFKRHVNQYIHDFESILRTLMGTRDGSALSVTLLSSDIGKLYVALAQAIDRLRT
jgi:hypothetical protein